ncbi:MAG: hypothetical protein JO355_08315 [Planctomycetaceae bacterium]|nr:hypothetical protein [Planctomycetaceae bacterium]MBV8266791.1 hypothetical protein [Planctomycetaceae bacterium]MBV8608589.1 hypothetical protein [Singulisphaera sp.]MBV8677154.1 hypothetical protein [Planctomycetaceae bacterium]
MPAPPRTKWPALRDRDPSDPARQAVELVQRGRMILDVSALDLEVAEAVLGPFHATAWHFRNALAEARRAWDRLRAELGGATLEAALAQPPVTLLTLGGGAPGSAPILLIPIAGQTYRVERVAATSLAPILWRLTRLHPPLDDGPYYAARLRDRSTRCDCAEWTYQIAGIAPHALCKHLAALAALGWI